LALNNFPSSKEDNYDGHSSMVDEGGLV
jgi:hypothetical protein